MGGAWIPRPFFEMEMGETVMRKIDAVILTYRPGKELGELLKRLASQSLSIHKIRIMNTRYGVFPEEIIAGYSNAEVVHLEKAEFDHGGTRHEAAKMSDADYVLFLTQDALPADRYLVEKLAEAFSDPRVKAAYARQLPREDCRELERYTRSFNYPEESRVKTKADLETLGIKTFFCSDVCAMYEMETYRREGGFVRRTIFNEDMIYAGGLIKKGYAVAYAAEAKVYHSHNYSGREQFHRNFDLAVSQADHPEIFQGIASEGEGIRMVKETARHCMRIGKPWLVFSLAVTSGCKYLGYKLGKNYKKLPRWMVTACTADRTYWEKGKGETV